MWNSNKIIIIQSLMNNKIVSKFTAFILLGQLTCPRKKKQGSKTKKPSSELLFVCNCTWNRSPPWRLLYMLWRMRLQLCSPKNLATDQDSFMSDECKAKVNFAVRRWNSNKACTPGFIFSLKHIALNLKAMKYLQSQINNREELWHNPDIGDQWWKY